MTTINSPLISTWTSVSNYLYTPPSVSSAIQQQCYGFFSDEFLKGNPYVDYFIEVGDVVCLSSRVLNSTKNPAPKGIIKGIIKGIKRTTQFYYFVDFGPSSAYEGTYGEFNGSPPLIPTPTGEWFGAMALKLCEKVNQTPSDGVNNWI